MIRLLVGICLMLIMCYIGIGMDRFYRKKVDIIREYMSFLSFASREITFLKTDIPTIIKKFISDKKTAFATFLQGIKGSMEKGENIYKVETPYLNSEEKRLIEGFFEGIGKSDYHEQGKVFSRFNLEGGEVLKKAEKYKKERGELAKKLFILGGIGLFIVIV